MRLLQHLISLVKMTGIALDCVPFLVSKIEVSTVFISSFEMPFWSVPFRLHPSDTGFFIPGPSCTPCPVWLLLCSCCACSSLPACLGWCLPSFPASMSQSDHHSFRGACPDHLLFPPSLWCPYSTFQGTVIAPPAPRMCFTTAVLHLFVSLLSSCLCFVIRLWTVWGQETYLFCSPLSGNARLICGINRYMDRMARYMDIFHCYSPVTDLTQTESNISWLVSKLHCLLPPIVSLLLILSSISVFFLKDCTHDLMPHTSLSCYNQPHI